MQTSFTRTSMAHARLPLLCLALLCGNPAQAADVTVYAAASLKNALGDIGTAYQATHPDTAVKASFASSSTLAKQIEAGAPAELFVSADRKWMDYLADRQLIEKASRRDLLGNTLVLIAPTAEPRTVAMTAGKPPALDGYLCLGETGSVPAGIYGRQALISLDWWTTMARKLVATEDVRAALAFVERGECQLGIVYETDARVSKKVMIAGRFPAGSHEPVVYPLTLLPNASPTARDYYRYIQGAEARAVFTRYGFRVLTP